MILLGFLELVFLKCMEHIKTTLLFLKIIKIRYMYIFIIKVTYMYVYIIKAICMYVCIYSMHKTCDSIETHKEKFTYHCVQGKPSLTCCCISCSLSPVKTETHYRLIFTQQCISKCQ